LVLAGVVLQGIAKKVAEQIDVPLDGLVTAFQFHAQPGTARQRQIPAQHSSDHA
jgi:hypothetical protein